MMTPDELAEHLDVIAAAQAHGCPVWAEWAARHWDTAGPRSGTSPTSSPTAVTGRPGC
jgi:hypothetical protein